MKVEKRKMATVDPDIAVETSPNKVGPHEGDLDQATKFSKFVAD